MSLIKFSHCSFLQINAIFINFFSLQVFPLNRVNHNSGPKLLDHIVQNGCFFFSLITGQKFSVSSSVQS